MAPTDLSLRRIVVTGGGGRLGARMVEQFAARGAHVVALVVSDAEAGRVPASPGPPDSVAIRVADVTSESAVSACFRSIGEDMGSIDALVHTVGMWSGTPLLETKLDDWELMIRVNLTSAFLCFREAARLMRSGGGGTLVGIGSRQGADRGVASQAAYSASKAGVIRLVESTAAEFAADGISCHAIAPSAILFDEDGEGVQASDLIEMTAYLISRGSALSGATIRAYGS